MEKDELLDFVVGDMLTTATSVARNCAMVGQKDQVIIVKATQPNEQEGCIEYELDESNVDTSTSEQSDFDTEVGVGSICLCFIYPICYTISPYVPSFSVL